jgi:hypothetical protein
MSGSVVARRVAAAPARAASEAWDIIVDLLAPARGSEARAELQSVRGVAITLIADEAFRDDAAVVRGEGPRVRIYCLYNDDAISGDDANENPLATTPTVGDWKMSLPCPPDDLAWVKAALAAKSNRITARSLGEAVEDDDASSGKSANHASVDWEGFLKS